MEGKMERKTGRGSPRTPFMRQIIINIGRTTYKELKISVTAKNERKSTKVIESI